MRPRCAELIYYAERGDSSPANSPFHPLLPFVIARIASVSAARGEDVRSAEQAASDANGGAMSAGLDRYKKRLSERLVQVRGPRSQRQFARELGVFQQNVNRYESGTTPHADFLIQLAVKEEISIDWLLLGRGRMRRER
jgi:hypothetical protein